MKDHFMVWWSYHQVWLLFILLLSPTCSPLAMAGPLQQKEKIPVIVMTDLYHPHQDVGDNFDLLMAYALPEVALKAVILDCSEPFRNKVAHPVSKGLYPDEGGPREAGFIPVLQLNYLFDRNVPYGVSPFRQMRTPQDAMRDLPAFEQQGIELLLKTLKESKQKIHLLSFGSLRTLAVAYLRAPELLKTKIARIHISAGASKPNFLEWNIALDTNAVVTLLTSKLPIALYPCAAGEANGIGYGSKHPAFSYDAYNTYFKLPKNRFIQKMHPRLQRYMDYAYGRYERSDFLKILEADSLPGFDPAVYNREHYVWEPALWMVVAGRKLVQRADNSFRMIPQEQVQSEDKILPSELRPCTLEVPPSGVYSFKETTKPSNFSIHYRGDPYLYERAFQDALPFLYQSFKPSPNFK